MRGAVLQEMSWGVVDAVAEMMREGWVQYNDQSLVSDSHSRGE